MGDLGLDQGPKKHVPRQTASGSMVAWWSTAFSCRASLQYLPKLLNAEIHTTHKVTNRESITTMWCRWNSSIRCRILSRCRYSRQRVRCLLTHCMCASNGLQGASRSRMNLSAFSESMRRRRFGWKPGIDSGTLPPRRRTTCPRSEPPWDPGFDRLRSCSGMVHGAPNSNS